MAENPRVKVVYSIDDLGAGLKHDFGGSVNNGDHKLAESIRSYLKTIS